MTAINEQATEPTRGVPYLLWEQEQGLERSIERLTEDIEELERRIVRARERRDEHRLLIVELRTARSLVEQAGIKVERRGSDVNLSVERLLAEPAA